MLQSTVLLFSAGFSTLCHSDDADSSVVMTFHHCHANISRSLWPAVSLSPIISTTVWPPSRLLSLTSGDMRTSEESLGWPRKIMEQELNGIDIKNLICGHLFLLLLFCCVPDLYLVNFSLILNGAQLLLVSARPLPLSSCLLVCLGLYLSKWKMQFSNDGFMQKR